jgi:hypothetical protein
MVPPQHPAAVYNRATAVGGGITAIDDTTAATQKKWWRKLYVRDESWTIV